jgi:hypothetical protein
MLRLSVTLAIVAIVGTAQYEMPLVLELDPEQPNTLVLVEPFQGGAARTSRLVGGVETTLVFDAAKLLTREGVMATIRVDAVRLAGTSIDILGLIPTETLCIVPNPDLASGGVAHLRPVQGTASMELTLETLSFATNPALEGVVPPIPFGALVEDEFPLSLVQMLGLLTGQEGVISIHQVLQDFLPPEIPVLGGAEVTVTATFANTQAIDPDPLLDDCDAFFGQP